MRVAVVLLGAVLLSSCTLLTDPEIDENLLARFESTPTTVEATALAPVVSDSGISTRVAFFNPGSATAVVEHGTCDPAPLVIEPSGRVRSANEGIACRAILLRLEIPAGSTRELSDFRPWSRFAEAGIRLDGADAQVGVLLNGRRVFSPRTRVR